MSCFIGLSLIHPKSSILCPIHPARYQDALVEIEDHLAQTDFQLMVNEPMMAICHGHQKFYLSMSAAHLHTHLQHLIVSDSEDESFMQTIVQCLMILKENFPSKIEIAMVSDLDLVFNLKKMVESQVPRRLMGRLRTQLQHAKADSLSKDQVDDLIYILGSPHHRDYQHKLRILALTSLSQSKIDRSVWVSLEREQVETIDIVTTDPLYEKYGIEVLEKIVRHNQQPRKSENMNPNMLDEVTQQPTTAKFAGPIDINSALFQLKQSLNISRVTWIISNLNLGSLEERKLKKLDSRVREVGSKFLSGAYADVPSGQLDRFGEGFAGYFEARKLGQDKRLVDQVMSKISKPPLQSSRTLS